MSPGGATFAPEHGCIAPALMVKYYLAGEPGNAWGRYQSSSSSIRCMMCGICGVLYEHEGSHVDPALLETMAACLRHRGPDGGGVFVSPSGRVGLAHRRLSIIDLAGGKQPMANEDGSLHVVFNGEIYNFPQLRERLVRSGHTFATNSDTEVILHLYEEHGPDCVKHLRGMFAFGLWDEPRRRLLLARDRLGKKPLCWHHRDGRFIFASGIEPILKHPGVGRAASPHAIDFFLTYQYVPHPLTIFEGIAKLPPGHVLVYENGQATVSRYWQPELKIDGGRSVDDWCEELRSRLTDAVRMRLISDVPLGAFLSGGLDSSIVVGLMAKLTAEPVKTFSIGFTNRRYDERSYARIAAERFRTDHREFIVEPDALKTLPHLVHHFNEPFGDSSAIPTFHLARVTREHVTVALTGDAGDELFLGYPRYVATRIARTIDRLGPIGRALGSPLWQKLPASVEQKTTMRKLKKFAATLSCPPAERYYRLIAIFNDEEKQHLYEPAFLEMADAGSFGFLDDLYRAAATDDPAAAVAYADLRSYLPCDLLAKVDIATMAAGLEARSPFLDHEFVEFALAIPPCLKMKGLSGKHLLKRAFADLLPPEIIHRRKMGFGVPISSWFRGELAGYVRETLCSPRTLGRGRFRPQCVTRLVEDHVAGRADNAYKIWNLLNLELWEREFIDGQ